MDSLRIFKTFKGSSKVKSGGGQSQKPQSSTGSGHTVMRERSLDEKPSVSKSEILAKLEKAKGPVRKNTKIQGQRFGDGFLKEVNASPKKEVRGDLKSNDPTDSLTTEKLKGMLHSNVVNFSGKEKEILSKILGK